MTNLVEVSQLAEWLESYRVQPLDQLHALLEQMGEAHGLLPQSQEGGVSAGRGQLPPAQVLVDVGLAD